MDDRRNHVLQYLSIRFAERLAQVGAGTPVGSRGDRLRRRPAESTIGLDKTELVPNERFGP